MHMDYSGRLGVRLRTEWVDGAQRLRLLPRRSWKLVGVTVALVAFKDLNLFTHMGSRGWVGGMDLVLFAVILLTLLLAIVGEFLGTETVGVERGELVISRGIGPLRRTFRYPVAGIAELNSVDAAVDAKGKRHIQHIFMRSKAGVVRFEYGGKAVYFADTLDEADGEQVVRWLKPRLPRSATELLPMHYGGTANLKL